MNKIIERIERLTGVSDLVSILAQRLAPTDLQSLLLEVYRLRSSQRSPSDVLANYEADRFSRPSAVSPLRLLAWEQTAFASLPSEFESIELSPVCPLGTSSVIAGVSQNWSVATSRNTEVVSDSTNVLALECALRRRNFLRADPRSSHPVHLAASHRLLRAQQFQNPNSVTHFSAFTLCSAGRDVGNERFDIMALGLHISFYLKAIRAFFDQELPLVLALTDYSDLDRRVALESHLFYPVQTSDPKVTCLMDDSRTSGKGYYPGLCFHIYAVDSVGQRIELVDGGAVDWSQRLLSNARERLVISGIGSERVCTAL